MQAAGRFPGGLEYRQIFKTGNRDIFTSPAPDVRARNVDTVRTYFRLQRERDLDTWITLWAGDGAQATPHLDGRLGRDGTNGSSEAPASPPDRKELILKFMLLLFDPENYWESVTEEQMAAALAEHQAFADYLTGRGVEFSGEAVQPAKAARALRPSATGAEVVDGPLADLREDIAGYYLVDCADMDEAVEIGGHCPIGGGIEIRPVWGAPPPPA